MEKKKVNLKDLVKEKYAGIAGQSREFNASSCCGGTSCCSDTTYTVFSEDYQHLDGYNPEADLGLGCGIPTDYAGILPGHHVLDLGSGAGNDCFVARSFIGDTGSVTGLDFTDEMIAKALENKAKTGFTNVDFVKGDIEEMPFSDNHFNVIISNCVLNLVPDKVKAFSEIFRVLKEGGHFCISDVVLQGDLPEKLKEDATMYAGCVSGALQHDEYLNLISLAGFQNVRIHKQRPIELPLEILASYLDGEELDRFAEGQTGIFSITVSGYKV